MRLLGFRVLRQQFSDELWGLAAVCLGLPAVLHALWNGIPWVLGESGAGEDEDASK